jgi:DNA anti-recombination protein RmuC
LAALIDIIIKNDDRSKTISNINEILSNLDKVYQLFVKWSKEWNTFVQQLNTVVKSAKNLTHRQRLILSKIEKLNKGENATFNNEDLIDETKMRENELTETSQSLRNKNDDVNSDN